MKNTKIPTAKVVRSERRFIIIEARIKHRKVKCFVDGGAERSIILQKVQEELKLAATPNEATIQGVGGAATTATKENEVPLFLGKKEATVKALGCNDVAIGDVLLAADWLYKHSVTGSGSGRVRVVDKRVNIEGRESGQDF